MEIRIGDIVRFISEKLEGKVSGIIDNNTVNVFCEEYGFEIPASVNNLVVIHSDFKTATTSKNTNTQKAVDIEPTNTVYVAFVPDNHNNLLDSHYEIHIINDTSQTCLYSIAFSNGEYYSGISAGNCNPDSTASLGNYSIKELDQLKTIHVQTIFYQKGKCILKHALDVELKLNTVSLCKGNVYKHTRWFNQVAWLRPLDKEQLEQITEIDIDPKQLFQAKKEKDKPTPSPTTTAPKVTPNVVEIDLHIQQLLDSTTGMESKDILEYQLEVFRKTLDKYKLRRGQKIIFIHGKGDGVLRQRILWELQTKYKRFHHQDASFKQYGYGATMVTIR